MAIGSLPGGSPGLTQLQLIERVQAARNRTAPADALTGPSSTVTPTFNVTPSSVVAPTFIALAPGSAHPPAVSAATLAGGSGTTPATGQPVIDSVSQSRSTIGPDLPGSQSDAISHALDGATASGSAPTVSNATSALAASRYAAASASASDGVSRAMIC